MKPMAIDLYCGLGGWAEGFLAEGYDVIGFDIERHDYGTGGYPGQLVLQDVRTLHGSQFKNATVIVASPPCQKYSYMAMPWSKAKALAKWYLEFCWRLVQLNELFDACFRIQAEASEAAGRHIPLIVENVRGAQPWVGRSDWNFGSYHLWGDIPALMPIPSTRRMKFPANCGPRLWSEREYVRLNDGSASGLGHREGATKVAGLDWSKFGTPGYKAQGFNVTAAQRYRQESGLKQGGDWFGAGESMSMSRRFSSRSNSRKAASAQIAKIPFPLAQHIARVMKASVK